LQVNRICLCLENSES